MSEKTITYKDLLQEKGEFKCYGTIENITGEKNKTYKSGFTGTDVKLTVRVGDKKQQIKVFGGTEKSEQQIRAFQLDAEGKIMKNDEGKAIQLKVYPSQFNPSTQTTFDKIEIFEWVKGEDGKNVKKVHDVALTAGRFANILLDKKDQFIGKRFQISGEARFKPNMDFSKLDIDMQVKQMVFAPVQEGKEARDTFIIQTPVIIDKSSILEITTENPVLQGFVSVYQKFLAPQVVNGREQKGEIVYVPFGFNVNEHGFLMMDERVSFDLEKRAGYLNKAVQSKVEDLDFAVVKALLSYKSGMIERNVEIDDLSEDFIFADDVAAYMAMAEGEAKESKKQEIIYAYKAMNPQSVRSEFKQQIDFVHYIGIKDNDRADIGVRPIEREMFKVMSLDAIKEIEEARKNTTTVAQPPKQPKEEVKNETFTGKVEEPTFGAPPSGINEFDDVEFPF